MIMEIRAKVLGKSLDRELVQKERINGSCLLVVIVLFVMFFIPTIVSSTHAIVPMIIGLLMVVILKFIDDRIRKSKNLIEKHTIGTLVCTKMYVIINAFDEEVWIDENFEGEVIITLNATAVDTVQNRYIYRDTHEFTLKTSTNERAFPIYFEKVNQHLIRDFLTLIDELNINYKEYTGGERTFLGKKLNYKEIQEFKRKRALRKAQHSST